MPETREQSTGEVPWLHLSRRSLCSEPPLPFNLVAIKSCMSVSQPTWEVKSGTLAIYPHEWEPRSVNLKRLSVSLQCLTHRAVELCTSLFSNLCRYRA